MDLREMTVVPTPIHASAYHIFTSPLLPREQRDVVVPHLHRITDGDAEAARVLPEIVLDVRKMKDEFKRQMEMARKRVFDELPAEKRRDTFANFYTDAVLWAEALADAEGLGAKCRTRGLDGLLKVRAVQFTVGAMKSLVYSQVVGEQWQPRHPHRGDGYDLWHAELASVGDVFVTGDEKLGKQLERVPLNDFRLVQGSLNKLLTVLERAD